MMTAARNRYFERLTRKNAALLLVDHQIGLFTGIRDIDVAQLKHNVVALAKAATTLGLPIIVTTTASGSMWGPTIPELKAALPTARIIDRSKVNAWDEPRIPEVIAATGRKKLIVAGSRPKFPWLFRPSPPPPPAMTSMPPSTHPRRSARPSAPPAFCAWYRPE
jgi:hypothetical protein